MVLGHEVMNPIIRIGENTMDFKVKFQGKDKA